MLTRLSVDQTFENRLTDATDVSGYLHSSCQNKPQTFKTYEPIQLNSLACKDHYKFDFNRCACNISKFIHTRNLKNKERIESKDIFLLLEVNVEGVVEVGVGCGRGVV